MPLANVIADGIQREENLERNLANEPSGTLVEFDMYKEKIILQDNSMRIYKRGVGSSFTIGNATLGKLGAGLNPQPTLGVIWAWERFQITGLSI